MRLFLFFSVWLLLSCASKASSPYVDANEPEQLSTEQLKKLEARAVNHDAKAAFHLYTYYLFAEDGMAKAMYWLRVAANDGYPQAEYNLGAFLKQSSSSRDQKEAEVWLAKAAKDGVTTPTK